jgi:hypothetical protein
VSNARANDVNVGDLPIRNRDDQPAVSNPSQIPESGADVAGGSRAAHINAEENFDTAELDDDIEEYDHSIEDERGYLIRTISGAEPIPDYVPTHHLHPFLQDQRWKEQNPETTEERNARQKEHARMLRRKAERMELERRQEAIREVRAKRAAAERQETNAMFMSLAEEVEQLRKALNLGPSEQLYIHRQRAIGKLEFRQFEESLAEIKGHMDRGDSTD